MTEDPQGPDAAAWRAVLQRDRRCDGQFVYVALTTNIYCRPSCPARLPNRRGVRVLPSATEAERRGYMACRRCHPGSLAPAEKSVQSVLGHIDAHFEDVTTLRTLSRICGLSPSQLQEMFTRIVGLSPKMFLGYRRFQRFKELLRSGTSIVSAAHAVGYGSSRAVYETASRSLGMTPATYGRGAAEVHIHYALAGAAPSRVLVARTERGICAVNVGEGDEAVVAELLGEFPRSHVVHDEASPEIWAQAVKACLPEDPLLATLPVQVRKDIFRARLWSAVLPPRRSAGRVSPGTRLSSFDEKKRIEAGPADSQNGRTRATTLVRRRGERIP